MEKAIFRISVRSSLAMFGSYGIALSTMLFASRTALARSGLMGGCFSGLKTLILWSFVNPCVRRGTRAPLEVPIPDQGLEPARGYVSRPACQNGLASCGSSGCSCSSSWSWSSAWSCGPHVSMAIPFCRSVDSRLCRSARVATGSTMGRKPDSPGSAAVASRGCLRSGR